MVKRQQSVGRWGGNLVVATMARNQVLLLPTLPIEQKSIKAMGLVKIIAARHPDTCAMIYENPHGAAWCIRHCMVSIPPAHRVYLPLSHQTDGKALPDAIIAGIEDYRPRLNTAAPTGWKEL